MSDTLKINTPRWALPLMQPARYKGAWGGRSSGKSNFFGEMLIEEHVMNPHQASVCCREIQKSLRQSVKRLLEIKLQQMDLGHMFDVQESCIKSKRGSGLITFAGLQNHTSDSIKSLESYDRAWIEEAQSVSQRSLDILRPTLRKPGSQIWASWNPDKPTDPIDALLRCANPPPDSIIVSVNYTDNPWLPKESLLEMEYDRGRDYDRYLNIWRGEYKKNSESRVFKNWTVEEFEAPADAEHRFGADFGFAADPTVLVRCHIIGRKIYIDYEAYMHACEIVNLPQLFLTIPDAEKWPIIADCARPETISHLRKNGFPKVMPCVKGKDSVIEGIEWLKSYDIVVHPRCVHTIDELANYSFKVDSSTGIVTGVLQDENNHVIDSIRYSCEATRRIQTKKPVSFVPLPSANRW